MALPHLAPFNTRKNIFEAVIVKNRDHENTFREKWNSNAQYFNKNNVITNQQDRWGSKNCFNRSMDKWQGFLKEEAKREKLEARRQKLAQLLKEERDMHQTELNALSDKSKDIEGMKNRSEALKSSREERRKKMADNLMLEHWRENTPELRMVESARHKKHVINCWTGQIVEKEDILKKEQDEREEYHKYLDDEFKQALMKEEDRENERRDKELQLQRILVAQTEKIKEEERKAEELKRNEELLVLQQINLEELNEEQKRKERINTNVAHGKTLLRQHAAALRRKSREVQKALEEDRIFLENMIELEKADEGIKTSRKVEARADAHLMIQLVREQMDYEKQREGEIDLFFQEEAKKVWEVRELQWEKEKQARQRLMNEVLMERQNQLIDKMEAVKIEQQKNLERKEEILNDIEVAHKLSQAEKQKYEQEKRQRKLELESAITARKDSQFVEKLELDNLLEQEKEEENNYDELLKLETERVNREPYRDRFYPKRQAWI